MKYKTAIILCGGKGTRLGAIGKKIPKSLVKIHNTEILWYIIMMLKKNSFNHFIFPVGYKGNMIKGYLKKKIFSKLNIEIVDTGKNTSIAKRLFKIKNKIKSKNFLLLNGDAIFDCDLKKAFNIHEEKKLNGTFLGCTAKLPFGVITKINNKIVGFVRNIEFNSINQRIKKNFIGFVYSGIVILNRSILNKNFKNYDNFEKELYPRIIRSKKVNLVEIKKFWHSIDNHKDIEDINNQKNSYKFKYLKKIKNKLNDI